MFLQTHGKISDTWHALLTDFAQWLVEVPPPAVKTATAPKRETAEKRLLLLMHVAMMFKESLTSANGLPATANGDGERAPKGMSVAVYNDVLELVQQQCEGKRLKAM